MDGSRATPERPEVLCVDDEKSVLEGLALHLRRRYHAHFATSGQEGLEVLAAHPGIAVVLSDMRMPGMIGAEFLARAREAAPLAVRMLLTGQADIESAIAAINDGAIFRFLTKPCPPPTLLGAFDAAAEQHRLITAERVLLEQTLQGSIRTLSEVLALTSPATFGRAARIKTRVSALIEKLAIKDAWPIEVAAMLCQLGAIALPPDVSDKHYHGRSLEPSEQAMVDRGPALAEQLLANIPRLEIVRGVLANQQKPLEELTRLRAKPGMEQVALGAELLRISTDYDLLEAHGDSPEIALGTLRGRRTFYDPSVFDAFVELYGGRGSAEVREVGVGGLVVGMTFVDDVRLAGGALLVARGYKITAHFLERCRNFPRGAVKEPLRVLGPTPGA